MTGLLQRFDRIPPKLCRLLARTDHGLRLMTAAEIGSRGGLNEARVIQISRMSSWAALPLGVVEAFSAACGVNLLSPSRQVAFLKRRKMAYLARATVAQRKMAARLMAELRQSGRGQSTA